MNGLKYNKLKKRAAIVILCVMTAVSMLPATSFVSGASESNTARNPVKSEQNKDLSKKDPLKDNVKQSKTDQAGRDADDPAETDTPVSIDASGRSSDKDSAGEDKYVEKTAQPSQKYEASTSEKNDDSKAVRSAETQKNESDVPSNDNNENTGTQEDAENRTLTADGQNYKVSVTYGEEAGVPAGAELEVSEIKEDGRRFDEYALKAEGALGLKDGTASSVRLFDIKIVDKNGKKTEIDAPVDVKIKLQDPNADSDTKVVHFADGSKSGDVMENVRIAGTDSAKGNVTLSFEAAGFSVYAIVDAPEPVEPGEIQTVHNLNELAENFDDSKGFYLSYNGSHYFTNVLNNNGAFVEKGNIADASRWYFEKVNGSDNTYYIYTKIDDVKMYMRNTNGNLMGLSENSGTAFTLSRPADSKFYFKKTSTTENKWLQHSGSGGGIRLWTDNNNAANSQITITYASSTAVPDDVYKLNGKTYGIAYHDNSSTAAALTDQERVSGNKHYLVGKKLIMKPDVLDNDGILLVAKNSDIREWTFESIEENKYYITTMVEGTKKYLTIGNGSVVLQDEPDSVHSVITATPGTGANSGKWHFTVNGYSLRLPGSEANGFDSGTGSANVTWMNLVEKSVLEDDDFTLYTAKKVSVSDTENVYDGQQVIIYTRIWNDTTKRYEFFAVDHNGSLIPCYDTGDGIEWTGSKVNTALWGFTEYHNSDGNPNYYYELQNVQYGNYIAPQISRDQIMSDSTIGINLNGRRFGSNYTTIIAWDDDDYSYSGLKTENGHITVCPLSEAEDFYFAVVHPVDPGDETTEAKTVDNDQYGISMKMIDYNNPIVGGRDSGQTAFFGGDNGVINTGTGKGLLSTDLKDDGYPVSTAKTGNEGTSLSGLYQDTATTPMKTANHLFLSSIYNESGYFEYDSTQNFSHLNDDGTFTVYDQLGAITGDSEHKNTREHGQFMPYNDIAGGRYAYDRDGELIRNQTDVYGNELPDTDARKGEVMYDVGNNKIAGQVDYFFGMEMSASFTQTASGLDAWGHDIIFEFSGDDDFWLYVDNELVLDLGGVHSAQVGTINFRTGKITSSNGNSTLYETFRSNYQTRGMSEAEISAKLDELFEEKTVDGERVYTFKDYTNHTMKVFYMERGAGSSNLHMRFNLAAVKPGTVELSKKLSGTDNPENNLIEFPYQIFYKSSQDAEYHLLTEKTGDDYNVLYKDSVRSVTYKDRFTPAGGTESYQNVFFLKSGEAAVINLPEDTVDYYIKECGIDPNVYDKVSANGTQLTGTPTGNGSRKDYAVEAATMLERQKVDFDNHVRPGAMRTLSITKKLYDSDGITLLHYPDDDTMFTFRLYLGNESADPNSLPLANNYSYYIKDAQGNYCRWVPAQKKFVSLGITDYAELAEYLSTLSNAEKEKIIFTTSMNGSISKITADHTVEIRDLIVDTQWKVEERDWELPKGYTRRDADGYKRVDSGHETQQREPISGTIKVNNDPEIQVQNQIGWGLTVKKIWTDKDFMESHDDIYFAVYLNSGNDLELIGGTVRPLTTSDTELYYFLDDLYNGTSTSHRFSDYEIREVMISNNHPIIEDGVVTNPGTVTPISDNGTLTTGGTPVGGSHKDGYEYTVNYKVGSTTSQNENIRTDEVTNSRPGIKLYKKNWAGNDLAGTVFTLKDSNGNDVAAPDYESDSDGLITIAYLSPGTYTLTETEVPGGYTALPSDMNITVNTNGTVSVSGLSENYYTLDTESDPKMAAVITIKDRASELKAIKKDADTEEPIDGVHFALYRQVTDTLGNKRKDYLPMSGYEDLVTFTDSETHESGIIPKITTDLAAGTYYLTETAVPEGSDYKLPDKDLCFTIGRDGNITIESEGHAGWLSIVDNGNGKVKNTITIPNSKKEIVPTGIPAHRMMHFIILLLAVTAAAWVFARYRNSSISRPYRS